MILEIKNVRKKYDHEVLKNINMKIDKPALIGISGNSGVGKTTLLRLIAGFEKVDSGEIYIRKELASSQKLQLEPYKRQLGYMFQTPCLWPHMTVEENIKYSNKNRKIPENIIEDIKLKKLLRRYPDELSGGEKKRVSLARALFSDATIILMDEPFANLDEKAVAELSHLIKNVFDDFQKTMIIVSHNATYLKELTHEIYHLIEGEMNV